MRGLSRLTCSGSSTEVSPKEGTLSSRKRKDLTAISHFRSNYPPSLWDKFALLQHFSVDLVRQASLVLSLDRLRPVLHSMSELATSSTHARRLSDKMIRVERSVLLQPFWRISLSQKQSSEGHDDVRRNNKETTHHLFGPVLHAIWGVNHSYRKRQLAV